MSGRTRKHFSEPLKAKVALEAIRAVKTVNEIAQEYGVHPTQVGQWKKELHEQAASIFDAKRGPKKGLKSHAVLGAKLNPFGNNQAEQPSLR